MSSQRNPKTGELIVKVLPAEFPAKVLEVWGDKLAEDGVELEAKDLTDAGLAAIATREAFNAARTGSEHTSRLTLHAKARLQGARFRKRADQFTEDAKRAEAFALALIEVTYAMADVALGGVLPNLLD